MSTVELRSLAERVLGQTAGEVARDAGVPREAVELAWSAEIVDLHLESFIPARLYRYDLHARHSYRFPLGGVFFGHLDLPRALGGGLTGGMWSIATNILRSASRRREVLARNVEDLKRTLEASPHVGIARDHRDWVRLRAEGKHAALVVVQGGNAFESPTAAAFENPGGLVTRVTVVHLSSSVLGATSSPLRGRGDPGLSDLGRDFVRWLDAERIFVDLAHASPRAFWDAVEVHDRSRPLIVTHTGIAEALPHWRNIDARQVRAVADSGGVVGIIFHRDFLGPGDGRRVVDHLESAIDAGGEDCAALGSDYDGFIVPPADLRDGGVGFYRLVAHMLARKWSETRIRKVLGTNFVQSFARLRP